MYCFWGLGATQSLSEDQLNTKFDAPYGLRSFVFFFTVGRELSSLIGLGWQVLSGFLRGIGGGTGVMVLSPSSSLEQPENNSDSNLAAFLLYFWREGSESELMTMGCIS